MKFICSFAAALAFAAICCLGCNNAPAPSGEDEHHEEHAHPTHGPHDGSLIELGSEEYHAELVHDEDAGTVTIYLLDSAAESAVPIAAESITINLTHDGQAEQFPLAASPDSGDPEGKSSRFASDDAELAADLDHEGATAQLVVTIEGKQFRGHIEHDHDHEGHDHSSHDHED